MYQVARAFYAVHAGHSQGFCESCRCALGRHSVFLESRLCGIVTNSGPVCHNGMQGLASEQVGSSQYDTGPPAQAQQALPWGQSAMTLPGVGHLGCMQAPASGPLSCSVGWVSDHSDLAQWSFWCWLRQRTVILACARGQQIQSHLPLSILNIMHHH